MNPKMKVNPGKPGDLDLLRACNGFGFDIWNECQFRDLVLW